MTNTRFSSDASDYGLCAGLKLLGWDFPKNAGLKELVEQAGLFPITVITALSQKQKQSLLEKELVLCQDLLDNAALVMKILHDQRKTEEVLKEARDLCGL